MKNLLWMVLVLGTVIALPLALRRPSEQLQTRSRQLVVISPHNEALRYEIEQAFREYHQRKTGEEIGIDWRTIGGTTEIVRYIRSTFMANFQHAWGQAHPEGGWNDRLAQAVFSAKTDTGAATPEAAARREFLSGSTGIDIDVFMGGGQYDYDALAKAGILVPCGVQRRHPEWFSGSEPILAAGGGGEVWFDPQDRYYATCFSTFGIVYNRDRLKQAGFSEDEIAHFGERWADLADPRLYGAVGIADPSQSGSITKCFEMLIQREMQDEVRRLTGSADPASPAVTPAVLNAAWAKGMDLVKRLGGNAAYLTFSATRVSVDAAAGQIAAGMTIDFYGRSQVEWEKEHQGRETISYRTPRAASTVSADPIGILRGAPHRELAEEFLDFTLSPEVQRIWAKYAGSAGGPRRYTLYRLPVRRDLYTPAEAAGSCIGDEQPFTLAHDFVYQSAWTGRLFNVMRILIKVMIIDCGPELRSAWGAILRQGGWEKISPAQQQAFSALPFDHQAAENAAQALASPEDQAVTRRDWIEFFRANYAKSAASAR